MQNYFHEMGYNLYTIRYYQLFLWLRWKLHFTENDRKFYSLICDSLEMVENAWKQSDFKNNQITRYQFNSPEIGEIGKICFWQL